jgi:hypothetical protein
MGKHKKIHCKSVSREEVVTSLCQAKAFADPAHAHAFLDMWIHGSAKDWSPLYGMPFVHHIAEKWDAPNKRRISVSKFILRERAARKTWLEMMNLPDDYPGGSRP